MSPREPQSVAMSEELKARLDAAGVRDNETLRAALQADPSLRADFDAFLQSNSDALATATINTLLQAFAAVENDEQMMSFYQSVPGELEQPLIAAVEAIIEQATAVGDDVTVGQLTERLDAFRQLCEMAQQAQEMPPVMRAIVGFFQAPDEAAAELFFADQRTLLQPFEAQQVLDALLEQAPPDTPGEVKQRLNDRQALLRRLRGDDDGVRFT